jgi:hypothetical protein
MQMHHPRATIVALTALLSVAQGGEASADPARDTRSADRRDTVALLKARIVAVSALNPLTPESIIAALGAEAGPPEMLSKYRREWTLRPSDLYAGGTIAQTKDRVFVEFTPAKALQVSFEDLVGGLLKVPYYSDLREAHHGEDSVATRVYAVDHVFLVTAGELRIQVPTSVPAEATNQSVKALEEGFATTRGLNSRTVRVDTILITSKAHARDDSMMPPLAERRRRAPVRTPDQRKRPRTEERTRR